MIAATTSGALARRQDGYALLGWLGLLGWRVEIRHDDGEWAGSAMRPYGEAGELRVAGQASTYRGVVSELFNGALHTLALAAA